MPSVHTPQSICRFGVARCDVTPPVGIYHRMWGAATHDRATGVHRPLTATAMSFRPNSGDDEVVLIAVDHCLLWAREMEQVVAAISKQTGVPTERILVSFSHTHAGGLMGLERVGLPGGDLIPTYLDALADHLAGIVTQARKTPQSATLTYGVGRCALAAQRDFWDEATRQFVCGFNPTGTSDDTVLLTRVTGSDGKTLATLVNYACHPTTLAWENTKISPDFPGAMREVVEAATGVPCVFLQGASGDLGPKEGFVGDTEVADRNGRQLAHAALATLESLPPPGTRFDYAGAVVSGATLGAWKHVPLDEKALAQKARWRSRRWTIELPYRAELPQLEATQAERTRWLTEEQAAQRAGDTAKARDAHAMVERMDRQLLRIRVLPPGKAFPLPVTLWQMGDALWLCVEAEHYQLLQTSLRERFPDLPIVVMTIVNGSRAAYLPTADTYGKGIYQESIALLEKGSLEKLIETLGNEIAKWVSA